MLGAGCSSFSCHYCSSLYLGEAPAGEWQCAGPGLMLYSAAPWGCSIGGRTAWKHGLRLGDFSPSSACSKRCVLWVWKSERIQVLETCPRESLLVPRFHGKKAKSFGPILAPFQTTYFTSLTLIISLVFLGFFSCLLPFFSSTVRNL